MKLQYFTLSEFDSPDSPGSGEKMNKDTLLRLDCAREIAQLPFIITSGYRTQSHNEQIGGVPDSAHTRGYATDISTKNLTRAQKNRIIASLVEMGFNRIGEGSNFIHVDNDPDKPENAYWDYS